MRVTNVTERAEGTRRIRMTWSGDAMRRQCAPRIAAMVALAVPTAASAAVASATAGRNPTELFSERS